MKLTKRCVFNGNYYTMDFPTMTEEMYENSKKLWVDERMVIQTAFNYLNADEREFIMTGTPPHVWDEMFFGMDAAEEA